MEMRHKLSSAIFAQGWIESQIDSMVTKTGETENEDPTAHLIATQLQEQWAIVSGAFDDLVKEKAESDHKLAIIESAFQ